MELLVLGTVLLALVVTLCCGALLEVFRQLAELRKVLSLDDQPRPLNLVRPEISLVELGVPSSIGVKAEEIVVFLSGTCATCLAIAEAFRGGAPESVWFVVAANEKHKVVVPLRSSSERLIIDPEGEIAARLGLEIVPTVLTLRFGAAVRAYAVATPRQVMSLIPTTPVVGRDTNGLRVEDQKAGVESTLAKTSPGAV